MRFWNVMFLGFTVWLSTSVAIAQPKSPTTLAAAVGSTTETGKAAPETQSPTPSGPAVSGTKAPGSGTGAESGSLPAPSSSTPGAAHQAADSNPGAVDGATYLVRLRDLEQRVDELKEQIRRSHTRLSLLSDTILAGGVGGARAEITFVNDMSNVFQLTRALFLLDGAVQNSKQDESGVLAEQKEIPIFSGSIPPGDHTIQVLVQLRGHGFGVFSYLQGYRFEIRSSHSFTVTEGKTIEVRAIAYEKGGVTVPLEQRPAMRYFERVKASIQGGKGPAAMPSKTEKSTSGSITVGAGSE